MNVNPKPKPPLPGSEYTFMTDTGRQPVPPGIPVVNLIPVGDGGPGPPLPRTHKRKKPKMARSPARELAQLPRWAQVAFAALIQEVERLATEAQSQPDWERIYANRTTEYEF